MANDSLPRAPRHRQRSCACGSCPTCRRLRARKQYRIAHEHGVRSKTDAARARAHLIELERQGITRCTIAEGCGLSEVQLYRIIHGLAREVMVDSEKRILAFDAVRACEVANSSRVDSTATRLRIQALVALGYPRSAIAREIGRNELKLRVEVTRRRALEVLALCRRIGDTAGPDLKVAAKARAKGWRVPADYDDELFYDPAWNGTEPEVPELSRAVENLREYDFLTSCGMGIEEVADRLAITVGYIQMLLKRRDAGVGVFAGELTTTEGIR